MDKMNGDLREDVPVSENEELIKVVFGVFLGMLILVILAVLGKRRSKRRRDFLLVGLSGSGKTATFVQLIYNRLPLTVTSISENVGDYTSGGSSVRVVDVPGHYRVRQKCFDTYKSRAKGIIFVVDSMTAQKEIRDVADVFYSIVSDSSTRPCSILVLCNKQDLATAKSAQVIRNILEKEINIVRDTRSRGLKSTTEEDTRKTVYVGKEGRDFEFSHLHQRVQFCESSAKENELNHLKDWIKRAL